MLDRETGFDAISMRGVANAWIRDIQIVNMDYGILAGTTDCCIGCYHHCERPLKYKRSQNLQILGSA
jgi:hypothetical protein